MHKAIEQAMKDPRFIEARKKDQEKAVEDAFNRFMVISCDYLYRNFNCKQNGLVKFAEFVRQSFDYAKEMPGYLEELNQALMDEAGVNTIFDEE